MSQQIFISYSHKDSQIANGLCNKIEELGIDCWIAPRNITPGAGWANSIAAAIPTCNMFLLVLSKDSNSSSQVLREVEIAVQNKLVIIPVRIEDIMPSGGMSYYLATMQWIDIKGIDIDTKISEISQRIKSILGSIEESESQEQLVNKLKAKDLGLEPIFKGGSKKQRQTKYKKLTIIILASVFVITAGLTLFLLRDSIFGDKASKEIQEETVSGEPTTVPLESTIVVFEDETLKGCVISTLEEIGVAVTEELTAADMAELQSLIVVSLEQKEEISNMFVASGNAFESGFISEVINIRSLKGLEYATNLEVLIIAGQNISDLSPIKDLSKLNTLIMNSNRITDVGNIQNLSDLFILQLDNNMISDISAVGNLNKLIVLSLNDNKISDIEAVKTLINLENLSLAVNDISDINALTGLIYIEHLDMTENQISGIEAIGSMENATTLHLSGNQIEDISPLANLENLETLDISGNKVADLSPLSNSVNLTELRIGHMEDISLDISVLQNLVNFTTLFAQGSRLENVDAINDMPELNYIKVGLKTYTNNLRLFLELRTGEYKVEVEGYEDFLSTYDSTLEYSAEDFELDPNMEVTIEDVTLEKAVYETLGSIGETVEGNLKVSDMFKLKSLIIINPEGDFTSELNFLPMDEMMKIVSNYVFITNKNIHSYEGIQYARNLEIFIVPSWGLEEYSYIRQLKSLKNLEIISFSGAGTHISEIDSLSELTKLRVLYLANPWHYSSDFQPLIGLEALEYIVISGGNSNIGALANLPNLIYLDIGGFDLSNKSSLYSTIDNLITLKMPYVDIDEYIRTRDLRLFAWNDGKMKFLDMSYCNLSSLDNITEDLPNLEYFILVGNKLDDISSLLTLEHLSELVIDEYTYSHNTETVNALEEKGCEVIVEDNSKS